MKFALLTATAAGAALVQVGASPIRVVVVTSTNQELPSNFRFGRAVPRPNANPNVAILVRPATTQSNHSGPCGGSRMCQRAIALSNAFRKALSWPLIEATERPQPHHHHHVRPIGSDSNRRTGSGPTPAPSPTHTSSTPAPTMATTAAAATASAQLFYVAACSCRSDGAGPVGPWEGRAVTFVLGCGIGVFLRMFWVLASVLYRLIKGPKEDENKYTEIFVVEEYEDGAAAPAPPTYTYSNENADKKDVNGEAAN
ncbi:hypothetical protein FPV67DRAFT_1786441 [Lyophyllum atratum]|nr:hypothetical protein FPV67DRAFT_1786441 [Lyophyllum atratum]